MRTFPITLEVDNLIDAISQSIKIAKEENIENINAVLLLIYSDNTFVVAQRCYSNSSWNETEHLFVGGSKVCYPMTVSKDTYPGADKKFDLLRFVSHFNIKLETNEVWYQTKFPRK